MALTSQSMGSQRLRCITRLRQQALHSKLRRGHGEAMGCKACCLSLVMQRNHCEPILCEVRATPLNLLFRPVLKKKPNKSCHKGAPKKWIFKSSQNEPSYSGKYSHTPWDPWESLVSWTNPGQILDKSWTNPGQTLDEPYGGPRSSYQHRLGSM